jgi:hypothetical protein
VYVGQGCDKGANQVWEVAELGNGYDAIIANYGGNEMCMNVKGGIYIQGTEMLAWPCNTVVTTNEQFRRPENTHYPSMSGWYYIVPAGNYGLALNVAGGSGEGRNIILWSKCSCLNEAMRFG